MTPLIDSHAHFDFPCFGADIDDHKRAQIWQRCQGLGVQKLIIPGTHPEQWLRAQTISQAYTGLYFAVGLHPWWANEWQTKLAPGDLKDQIHSFIKNSQCVAIGECGLDKTIETPLAVQQEWLAAQLTIAHNYQLPVIIHSVKTHNEVIQQLKKMHHHCGGVIHAFNGSYEIAKAYWDMGFYLGIGGTITYPRANKTREGVKKMPLESLLLETDAPDMPLNGRQGEANSPEFLPEVAQCLAQLRNVDFETIAAQTTENTLKLFKKMSKV